ncbi:MAG: hypothetical protein RR825_01515, partial [Ruthenibacterium sp.]
DRMRLHKTASSKKAGTGGSLILFHCGRDRTGQNMILRISRRLAPSIALQGILQQLLRRSSEAINREAAR